MSDDEKQDPERLDAEAKALEADAARHRERVREEAEEAEIEDDEARRLREKAGRERHEHETVDITMVVNGQPVEIKARKDEKLAHVRNKALEETHNLAQGPDNWEIKDEAGAVLDPEKAVGEFHFGPKVTLFLSLKAGIAGA
jgi:hypothetical protein